MRQFIKKIRLFFFSFKKDAQMSALLNLIQFVAVMESTIQIYVNWRKPNAWGTQACIKYLMERVLHNDQGGSCNTYNLFSVSQIPSDFYSSAPFFQDFEKWRTYMILKCSMLTYVNLKIHIQTTITL